ncbi:hypothetical protein QJ857_gp0702 [Tupanvirus soda lake]|uniref:Viral late gene transcription factor 3 zinc ribbon domain-containing protein n=2 Tax=Tupanvirus TaxID=2094720 RepID=A0A6N1NLF7_9VIRU|nr:hypothetical protein QJ857_gp0702 [Tupanvirus soda lake]QKU35345.1 hypothetical protein [Tupanvirus soda lake]
MTKIKNRKNDASKTKKGTLDQKHTEKLSRFEKLSKSLPAKKQKLKKLENELDELMNMRANKCGHDEIRRKSHLMDVIDKLRQEIYSIENCTESLNYIVKTLPILVDYYDNDEIVDDGIEEEFVNDTNETGKKTILSYFMKETNNINNNNNKTTNTKSGAKKVTTKKASGSKTDKPTKQVSRAKLYDSYLCATETNHKKINQMKNNICTKPECDGEKILSQNDGYMVCKKCGLSEPILLTTEKPNYKEPTQDSGTYAYKRINHLTEILSQLQAKESTDIPPKVFEAIHRELKKRKIDKNDLDIFRLRRILKTLNYRKYYEHVPHILQIINGKEPPNFSRKDEMRIKKMFKDIQKPFAIYCPKNRKNFLNYSYVLHKFCELLDLDEYISYFPLLKNNAKLLQHDKIWRNICKYMKWEFYKSL